jgi:hypothetical protein
MPEAKLSMKLTNPPVKSSKINLRLTTHGSRCTENHKEELKVLTVNRVPSTMYGEPSSHSLTRKTGGHKMDGVQDRLSLAHPLIAKKVSSFGRGFGPKFPEPV